MKNIKPLSDLKIKNSKPKTKPYQLSDVNGLFLLIKPDNKRPWHMRYTSPTTGKRKLSSFGSYPTISLSMARVKRDEYIKLITNGIDPIDAKKKNLKEKKLNINSKVENVIYEWLNKEAETTVVSTQKSKKRLFEKDVIPFFNKHNVTHIQDIKIDNLFLLLDTKQKTAPEIASRLFNYLTNLLKYAVFKGYTQTNCLINIRKKDIINPRRVKHYCKISDPDIFKLLIHKIYSFDGSVSVKNALKFVLHVPLRAENLCKLKWDFIDFDKSILTIPRSLMKVKNPNLSDFILPLAEEVINILKKQYEYVTKLFGKREYVFIGNDGINPIHKESPNRALQRLDFNDESLGRKIRLHGFRGTFRSFIDTMDLNNRFSYEVKERSLDHYEKSAVVRAYTHKANYYNQLQSLMKWWSGYICSLKV